MSKNHSLSLTNFSLETQEEAEAGTIKEDCLLACFPWLINLLFFLYNPGPTTQGWHQSQSEEYPPISVVNEEKHHADIP